jgi:hypothetical protein
LTKARLFDEKCKAVCAAGVAGTPPSRAAAASNITSATCDDEFREELNATDSNHQKPLADVEVRAIDQASYRGATCGPTRERTHELSRINRPFVLLTTTPGCKIGSS